MVDADGETPTEGEEPWSDYWQTAYLGFRPGKVVIEISFVGEVQLRRRRRRR